MVGAQAYLRFSNTVIEKKTTANEADLARRSIGVRRYVTSINSVLAANRPLGRLHYVTC